MADDELDLEYGDPERAESSPAARRRAARKSAGTTKSSSSNSGGASDSQIRSQLDQVFDRIIKMLDERGDDELATVIREDGGSMASGLIALTTGVKFLRLPLIVGLNLVLPLMAFGRVGKILARRFNEWRWNRAMAQREQANGAEDASGYSVVSP
jgi:hypothetical protein